MNILFQGDSITDASRNRDSAQANQPAALGSGYANLIAARSLKNKPKANLSFLNRGISGNRIVDLYARWKSDALNLKPDLISILIGVNDLWHESKHSNGVDLKRFETMYRLLLEFTREQLVNTKLVICEPFLLPCGVADESWFEDMSERRAIVEKLAHEFSASFVPFQTKFDAALELAPAAFWAEDGVHPSPAGHQLMADAWLEVAGHLIE